MRVAIIGGGIAGLIAAHSFITRGVRPMLFSTSELGGQFASLRAVKFLRFVPGRETSIATLLGSLGLAFDYAPVRGGVLIEMVGNGRSPIVLPHPECLRWPVLGPEIQRAHWSKTRFSGNVTAHSMNNDDIPKGYAVMKLATDLEAFVAGLISAVRSGADVAVRAPVSVVTGRTLVTTHAETAFDVLVFTAPLWSLKSIYQGPETIPTARAHRLMVRSYEAPSFTAALGLDYLYTPTTAFRMVHRVSSDALSGLVTIEANRRHSHASDDERSLERDVRHLLGNDATLVEKSETHGHLIPLDAAFDLPEQIIPLGRFAQWDSRATVDVVFERAEEIADRVTR